MGERIFFGGMETANPLVASSSPLTERLEGVRACREAGFGGVILKTAADYRRTGNGYGRRVVSLGDDYFADSSYEREILTMEEGLALFRDSLEIAGDMAVIPSVSADSMEAGDWLDVCRSFESLGARLVQLDFFYLGTVIRFGEDGFYGRLGELLVKLQEGLECRIMPKLNFNFDPQKTCGVLAECGVRCVSLLDSVRFPLPERYGLHKDTTSYFGRKQLPLTLRYLECAAGAGLEACAGGGVACVEDVDLLLGKGARLVQTASFVLKNGFGYAPVLLHGKPMVLERECRTWCGAERYGGEGCEMCGFCRITGSCGVGC